MPGRSPGDSGALQGPAQLYCSPRGKPRAPSRAAALEVGRRPGSTGVWLGSPSPHCFMSGRVSARSGGRAPRSACICWLRARGRIVPKLHKQQSWGWGGDTQAQSPALPLTAHTASAMSLSLVVSTLHGRGGDVVHSEQGCCTGSCVLWDTLLRQDAREYVRWTKCSPTP